MSKLVFNMFKNIYKEKVTESLQFTYCNLNCLIKSMGHLVLIESVRSVIDHTDSKSIKLCQHQIALQFELQFISSCLLGFCKT